MKHLIIIFFVIVTISLPAQAQTPQTTTNIPIVTLEETKSTKMKEPSPVPVVKLDETQSTSATQPIETKSKAKIVRKTAKPKTTLPPPPPPPAEQTPTAETPRVDNIASLKEKDLTKSTASSGWFLKGRTMVGVAGMAFLDFGTYEDMYLSDADRMAIANAGATVDDVTAGGFGVKLLVEQGFSERISGSLQVGYSRLTYSNKYKSLVEENFFTVDALANYYLLKSPKNVMPFITVGGGLTFSGVTALPTLNLGGGAHIFVSDHVSIRGQLLAKTAFVFNRIEPSIGATYHFK